MFRKIKYSLGLRGVLFFSSWLIVILSLVTVMNVVYQNRILMQRERDNARKTGELILTAMAYPMLNGDQDVIQKQFDAYQSLEGLEVAHLTDGNGVIRRSTDRKLIGLPILSPYIEDALRGKEFHGLEKRKGSGNTIYSEVIPLKNEKRCYACHGKEEAVLGVLRVGVKWEPVIQAVRANRDRNIYISLFGLSVMIFLSILVIFRIVVQPIRKLAYGVRKVSEGDLEAAIVTESKDEIGDLTGLFNKMTQDLKRLMDGEQEKSEELSSANITLQNEISERRRIELAIQDTNRRLSDIINFLPDPALVIDKDGKVIAWNKAMEELTGIKAEEMLGKGDYLYSVPLYGQARPLLADAAIHPEFLLEGRYSLLSREGDTLIGESFAPALFNGNGRYMWAKAVPLYDIKGSVVGAIETFRDITERKMSEIAIEESSQRLSDIIDFLPDATFAIDLEGKVIAWNKAIEKLTGIRPVEILGKGDREYSISFYGERRPILIDLALHPELLSEMNYNSIAKEGSAMIGESFTPNMYGGKGAFMWGKATPLCDTKGNIVGAIESIRDITERKTAEERLQNAYNELKQVQSQLIQSAKMASVGTLAGGVAHEINNPLTGVLNNVQLIKMLAKEKSTFNMADFEELLNVIEDSAHRCIKITRSLLDFSHVSKGEFKPVDVNEIIEKVLNFVEHDMNLENIRLDKVLAPNLPAISGDQQLLQQVILDLVSNSRWAIRKKSGADGGVITLKTENNPKAKGVNILVSDSGIGIAKENLEKIFEPFFTTKEVGEGTGLGMAITYSIVKVHSGQIDVNSEVGRGTSFKIFLPYF